MTDKFVMKSTDEIEKGIAEALKPQNPFPFPPRPPVAVVEQAPAKPTATDKPWEPQRTLTQFLVDIETQLGLAEKHFTEVTEELGQRQVGTDDRIVKMEKSLAQILASINDRQGLILDRIGVIENLIGVR